MGTPLSDTAAKAFSATSSTPPTTTPVTIVVIWGTSHVTVACHLGRITTSLLRRVKVPARRIRRRRLYLLPAKTGRVNYTTLEDVPEGTQVMACMFSINHCLAIVLFDSRASHTIISQACVARLNLHVIQMKRPYIIHAPGIHLSTSQLVRVVPLDLSGKIFQTTPIVLPSQGIDVILGMN